MKPESARDIIVYLVGHGFDRVDLLDMGQAELRWWFTGVQKHNQAKADAQRKAAGKGKPKGKRAKGKKQ